jgi:hypothetical protein
MNSILGNNIKDEISEDDMKFIEELISIKDSKLNSATLLELLKAYDMTGRSYIESLPLEMVVVDRL